MTVGLQARDIAQVSSTRGDRRILVVSDDPSLQTGIVEALSRRGAQLQLVEDRETYLASASRESFDAILLDLGGGQSPWCLELLQQNVGQCAVVVTVAAGREAEALDAMEHGADAYLIRPHSAEQAATMLTLAAEARVSLQRLEVAEGRLAVLEAEDELIGHSPAMRRLVSAVSRAADNDATVLIEGAPGVGKTLVARSIHRGGRRAAEAFVVLQGDNADESAFGSAIAASSGGTLVIEDVEKLNSACQSKLVKILKDGARARGVRLVATTTARLAELTAKSAFREDLYYRLNMFPIAVPTLAERREDVPVLANRFLSRSSERNGLVDKGFTPAAMIVLEAHPWPGNVSQLEHAVTRGHGLADGGPIDRVHLFGPATGLKPPPGVAGLTDSMHGEDEDEVGEDDILPFHEEEKRLLGRALQATKGNVRRAAQLLGIGRATLYRKIQIYQLRLQ